MSFKDSLDHKKDLRFSLTLKRYFILVDVILIESSIYFKSFPSSTLSPSD